LAETKRKNVKWVQFVGFMPAYWKDS